MRVGPVPARWGGVAAGSYGDRMLLRLAGSLALTGLLAAGCSGGDDPGSAPTTSTPARSTSGGTVSASPSPSPTLALPAGCDALLPFTDLDQALGRPLFGETVYIKGVPQPAIGRTGRVTCRYGLTRGGRGVAPVEVGVSTYKDVGSAADRVQDTVAQLRREGGSSASEATVAGVPAFVVGNRTSVTCVLAQGTRTVAVTVQRSLRGDVGRSAIRVAEKVVANLGQ